MDNEALKSILILDDDADYRNLLNAFLKKHFPDTGLHQYDPLAEGAPAEDFDWSQYDLLLLDYQLSIPGITGLDILQKNKSKPDFPGTIMLTASEDEELSYRVIKTGASAFIRKQELTKTLLHSAIIEAWKKQRADRKRKQKLDKIQRAFSKKIFYQTLKQDVETIPGVNNRILIGFRIREQESDSPLHSFDRDRVVRHIAKNAYSFFQNLNLDLNITLFSEKMAVVLLDIQQDINNVIELIKNLHQVQLDEPFASENGKLDYGVDTGILYLSQGTISQEDLAEYFQVACDKAGQAELAGNRIHVVDADRKNVVAQEKASIKSSIEAENLLYIKSFDVQFDQSALDDKAKEIVDALNEKRLVQTYQSVVQLSGQEGDEFLDREIYRVSSQLVQENGEAIPANQLFSEINNDELNKFYDRWLLKETIGIIMGLNKVAAEGFYILNLSHESIADTTLFNWLRSLLSGFENKHPGRQIILEISNADFETNSKQVGALMKYLHDAHGFMFALSHVDNAESVKAAMAYPQFGFFMLQHELLPALKSIKVDADSTGNFTMHMREDERRIIAREINDAAALTEAISHGADFATGEFVGPALTSIEDETSIESYDVESLGTIH